MQYSQYYPQIIEDLKMNETQSLFQPKEGTLISKLNDKEQLKELIVIFSHKKKEFVSKEIIFGFNSVIISNQYVELSRCYFEMRYTKIRNSDGFYIISIHQGNAKEFMIASNQTQFMRMQIFLKRFCINKNFAGKYQLIDQNGCLPQAQSYKNSEQYCVLMWDKRKVKDEREQEVFHNNITIMHALQVSPNLVKVYEDNTKFYLVCQNMKLQSLETLLLNGFEFKEVPLVSIIFIIFQTLQKYKAKGIYHGNISLQSVFINISSPVLQIAVLFPKYLSNSDYTIDNDLYNVGVMLYKITFHNQKTKYTQFVDLNLIDHKKQQMHDPNYKETQYKFLYRISQLDLLTQLLLPGATLEQVLRHQWFVTIKQNLKMEQTKPVHRQSLNTIVESVNELSMTSSQDRMYFIPQQQNDYEIEEEFPIKCQIHNPFAMVPSKMKHDLILQYTQKSKTFSNFEIKREEIISISKQPSVL